MTSSTYYLLNFINQQISSMIRKESEDIKMTRIKISLYLYIYIYILNVDVSNTFCLVVNKCLKIVDG